MIPILRTKYVTVFALIFCMGVFTFTVNAYASAPPTVWAGIVGEVIQIEAVSGDYDVEAVFINNLRFNYRVDSTLRVDLLGFRDNETISVFAVDFAGNMSNIVTFNNPHFIEPFELQWGNENQQNNAQQESAQQESGQQGNEEPVVNGESQTTEGQQRSQGNPFTPDGQASVLDHAHDGDNKEFFTFQTPAGNVFFLIVDHERPNDNVYFLNAVTEQDLITLAEQSGTPISEGIPVAVTPPPPAEPVETPPPIPEPIPEQGGGNGSMIFLLLAVAIAGGAGYYFKIVRPRRQSQGNDDFEDEDEDEEQEMQFEDEPEESDEQEEPDEQGDYYVTDDAEEPANITETEDDE